MTSLEAPPLPSPDSSRMERLVAVIQELSLARSVTRVMEIVRRSARELVQADGASFVLREGDWCHYADEDAILPLWKGQRFPVRECISGMAMESKQPIVIPDIYSDPRIPLAAYGPTFVKSLVMVPIRSEQPIGAIGAYWSTQRRASPEEVRLLQALADSTSIAFENVGLYSELELRVKERTRELEHVNRELEMFSYSVSHDLRAPLRHMNGYSLALLEDYGAKLEGEGRQYLERIRHSARHMEELIDALLQLSRVTRTPLEKQRVDLSQLFGSELELLRASSPERKVRLEVQPGLTADGDPHLLRIVVANLLGNAWKFTRKTAEAIIQVGVQPLAQGERVYFVRDNGAGFDMSYASKLFGAFQRFHSTRDFDGTGIGLATVQRVLARHGGRIWAEAAPNAGATFFFTLEEGAEARSVLEVR